MKTVQWTSFDLMMVGVQYKFCSLQAIANRTALQLLLPYLD